jgi:hypothetical protein
VISSTLPRNPQQVFQPADGVHVEVVGRLVEQQHVRLGHQTLGQRHALLQPPESASTRT